MAKKMNYKKAGIVGLCWSIAYFCVVLYYTYMDLGFNLLSTTQWQSTYIAFVNGLWAIDSKEGVLLLLTILLFFPLWIVGWVAFYKVNWRLPLWMKHKEKEFKRELIVTPKKGKLHVPVKLRLQNSSFKSAHTPITPVKREDTKTHQVSTPQTQAVNDIQDIIALSENFAVDTFQNVVLGDEKVPLAISTDDVAVLITMLDTPGAAWAADLSQNGEWYTAGARLPSPITTIQTAAAILQELEPDSQVIPVLVITRGEIMDADSVVSFCTQQNVRLLRFNDGMPDTIPELIDFMNNTFRKKEA